MRRGGRRLAALFITMAALNAACLPEASVAPATPSPTLEPDATATVTRLELGTTVWYAGWTLAFGSAQASLDPKGGDVAVGLTLHNDGPDEAAFDEPIRLVAGSAAFEPTRESVLPDVASGGAARSEIRFTVMGRLDLASAAVVIGGPEAHQAVVPLGQPARAVTLEPVEIAQPAKPVVTAGSLKLSMQRAEVRADLPDWSLELHSDRLAITITYDMAYVGSFDGGASFTADNVRLRLPNGTSVAPRRDGRSQSTAVLLPKAAARGLTSRFEIPTPAGGTYQLVLQDGTRGAAVAFVIPKMP